MKVFESVERWAYESVERMAGNLVVQAVEKWVARMVVMMAETMGIAPVGLSVVCLAALTDSWKVDMWVDYTVVSLAASLVDKRVDQTAAT